ncbi:MAG: peptidoglycan-binding domain-containing protein [Pseudomonadota bacterium]
MRAVKYTPILAFMAVAAVLGGCSAVDTAMDTAIDTVARSDTELQRFTAAEGPPNAAPGSCWGKDVTPAVYETITEAILLQPAELGTDGTVRSPAVYKTETRQAIVRERTEIWFETPCEAALTTEFVSSVQRALAVRGLYRGPVTGEMDRATLSAVRAFQAPQGLDSAILSIAAARQLGLVAVERS